MPIKDHGTPARYRYGPGLNGEPGGCRCLPCTNAKAATRRLQPTVNTPDSEGLPADIGPVRSAVAEDLELWAADRGLRGLRALALALAEEVDHPSARLTSIAVPARGLRDTLAELRALAKGDESSEDDRFLAGLALPAAVCNPA